MSEIIIFYDLDEVLNWFSKTVIAMYNYDFEDDFKWEDNTSYWWSDAPKGDRKYFEKLLNTKGIFRIIQPQLFGLKYMEQLIEEGYDVKLATKPMWNSNCLAEKLEWIKDYMPFFDYDKNLYFTSDKSLLSKENRILFDDNTDNLKAWNKMGGIAIALETNFNKDWEGLKVSTHEEFYFLVKQLIKSIEYGKEQPSLKKGFRIDLSRGYTVGKALL